MRRSRLTSPSMKPVYYVLLVVAIIALINLDSTTSVTTSETIG
jgi:hypothetical protein